MIVSASRRTDIPAFYGPWFMNRIREGFALIPNPHTPLHFSRVRLDSQAAECIVFWSKNPEPFLDSTMNLICISKQDVDNYINSHVNSNSVSAELITNDHNMPKQGVFLRLY